MKRNTGIRFRAFLSAILVLICLWGFLHTDGVPVMAESLKQSLLIDTLKLTPDMGLVVTDIYFPQFAWDKGIVFNIVRTDGISMEHDFLKAHFKIESDSGNNCNGLMYLSSRNILYTQYLNIYGEGKFDMTTFESMVIDARTNGGWSDWIEIPMTGKNGFLIIQGGTSQCNGSDAVLSLEVFHSSRRKPPEINSKGNQSGSSSGQKMVYGPESGLIQRKSVGTFFESGVDLSDFLAGVKFFNPPGDAWDYGIAFRGRDGRWLLLSITSDANWFLFCGIDGKMNTIESGKINNLISGENAGNYVEIHAAGDRASFLINRKEVTILDISCAGGPGNVSLSTGWLFPLDDGGATRFEDFVVYASEELGVQASCPSGNPDDCDGDGLPQAEETWIANTFVPRYVLDKKEPSFPPSFIFQVTPFNNLPSGINKPGVILTINALYNADFAYPSLLGLPEVEFLWHYGDNEVIEIWLSRGVSDCSKEWENVYPAYTAAGVCYSMEKFVIHAHSHTREFFVRDPRYEFNLNTFDTSTFGTHLVLYISKGKHAAYMNEGYDCEETTYQGTKWCFEGICVSELREICSSISQSTKAGHNLLPVLTDTQNVGEAMNPKKGTFPLLNKLSENPLFNNAFPCETAWGEEEFCGGHRFGDYCELTFLNPYERMSVPVAGWTITGDLPDCAGSNRSKWCGGGSSDYCGGQ